MHKKSFLTFIVLSACMVAFCNGKALAQGPGVEVDSVSPILQQVDAGEIVSLSFRVHNQTDSEHEFEELVDLPEGWHLIVPPDRFVLGPGEEIARQLAVHVPSAARARSYKLTYEARSEREPAVSDSETIELRVSPVQAIDLIVIDAPERVMAGEDFEIRARMVNRGNITLSMQLGVTEREEFPARVTPEEVERLAPGRSVEILVEVGTDPNLDRPRTHRVRLTAEGHPAVLPGKKVTVSETIRVPVEVVPRVSEIEDMYHTFPIEFRTNFMTDDGDSGAQFELEGAGYLDEEEERHLDFFIRIPDQHDVGIFGRREEYGATYSEPDFTVKLGDRRYELSQLTTQRFARGVGFDYHPEDSIFEAGTFYAQDIRRRRKRRDVGTYAGVSPSEAVSLRLNALRRTVDEHGTRPSARDNVFSLTGDFDIFDDSLELEYAYSDSDRENGVRDQAYSASYRGSAFHDVSYSLRHRHYGPDYYGRSRDSEYSTGSVTFPVFRDVRGNMSYTRWDRNLDRDEDRGTAPLSQRYRGGLSWRFAEVYRISADLEEYRREDRNPAPSPQFDYKERAAIMALRRSFDWGSARVDARRGRMKDELADSSDYAWSFGSSATYRPHRNLRISAFGDYGERYNEDPSNRIIRTTRRYGGRARWEVSNALNLNADATRYDYEERPGRSQYSAGAEYTFENNHSIRADVRHSERRGRDNRTSAFLSYIIPFDVPLRRKSSVGAVEGHVMVVEDDGRRARTMENVIIFADGASAVTDANGKFIFPALEPGVHELKVDMQSMGPEYVPIQDMPINVEVEGGKTKQVNIEMARGGSLAGRVVVMPNDGEEAGGGGEAGRYNLQGDGNNNNNNLLNNNIRGDGNNNNNLQGDGSGDGAEGGLSGVLVEMRRDGKLKRTLTGARGEFLFERLEPGEWTLKVYDDRLPEYHYIETPERKVTIEPEEREEVIVNVRPREREVRIIDEGEIE